MPTLEGGAKDEKHKQNRHIAGVYIGGGGGGGGGGPKIRVPFLGVPKIRIPVFLDRGAPTQGTTTSM